MNSPDIVWSSDEVPLTRTPEGSYRCAPAASVDWGRLLGPNGYNDLAERRPNVERPVQPLPPTVLHSGRCGSTWLANLLTASRGVVLIEPVAVSDALQASSGVGGSTDHDGPADVDEAAHVLTALAASAPDAPAIWKAAAADVVNAAPLVAAAQGKVVFIADRVVPTIESYQTRPPSWIGRIVQPVGAINAAYPVPDEFETDGRFSLVTFLERVWRSCVTAGLDLPLEVSMVVTYEQLVTTPHDVVARVAEHLEIDAPSTADIAAELSLYSKDRSVPFDPGSQHRRQSLRPKTRREVDARTDALWQQVLDRSAHDGRS